MHLHQRDQSVDFGLGRGELGEDAAQTESLLAQPRSDPVLATRRRISLVEDQIDHLEHRAEARHTLGPRRHLEPDVRFGEGALRPDDALGDRRDGDKEPACDLLGRQTPQGAKCQSNACVSRENRMARHEDEAEEVVPDVFVGGHLEVNALTSPLDVTTDLLVLALERLSAADQIDRLMLRGPHQPGARLLRHA